MNIMNDITSLNMYQPATGSFVVLLLAIFISCVFSHLKTAWQYS